MQRKECTHVGLTICLKCTSLFARFLHVLFKLPLILQQRTGNEFQSIIQAIIITQ